MGVIAVAIALDVSLDVAHRAILRTAVDNQVLHSRIGLLRDTMQGAVDGGLGIIGNSSNCESDHFSFSNYFSFAILLYRSMCLRTTLSSFQASTAFWAAFADSSS